MKNLFITLLLVIGLSSFAQNRKDMGNRPDRSEMQKLSPEQRNQLMVKKMTLELDLNAKQQEQVGRIITERSAKMEEMKANEKKSTADERFQMKSKMLDEQIAMKAKMKSILSSEQFEKWTKLKEKHQEIRGEKRHYNKY